MIARPEDKQWDSEKPTTGELIVSEVNLITPLVGSVANVPVLNVRTYLEKETEELKRKKEKERLEKLKDIKEKAETGVEPSTDQEFGDLSPLLYLSPIDGPAGDTYMHNAMNAKNLREVAFRTQIPVWEILLYNQILRVDNLEENEVPECAKITAITLAPFQSIKLPYLVHRHLDSGSMNIDNYLYACEEPTEPPPSDMLFVVWYDYVVKPGDTLTSLVRRSVQEGYIDYFEDSNSPGGTDILVDYNNTGERAKRWAKDASNGTPYQLIVGETISVPFNDRPPLIDVDDLSTEQLTAKEAADSWKGVLEDLKALRYNLEDADFGNRMKRDNQLTYAKIRAAHLQKEYADLLKEAVKEGFLKQSEADQKIDTEDNSSGTRYGMPDLPDWV